MQKFELSPNNTTKLLTWEPLLIVRLSILQPGLTTNIMRPIRRKPYQEHTFALRIPLELYDDRLVLLKLEHLSWSCLLGESCELLPHTLLWERLSISISSLIHDHDIYGKLQAYDLF
jgi:hypothetical protein